VPAPECGPAGHHVVAGSGTIDGVGPIASLALAVYNGDGTGTLTSATQTVNGSSSTANNVPITYTVNRDFTGSKVLGSGPSAVHMNFVISSDGNKKLSEIREDAEKGRFAKTVPLGCPLWDEGIAALVNAYDGMATSHSHMEEYLQAHETPKRKNGILLIAAGVILGLVCALLLRTFGWSGKLT
jgi:hypothetical protein